MPGVPTIFANLAAGNQPLSLFDQMFNLFATFVAIPCTPSGTNAIALTPIGQAPIIPSYQNFVYARFQATATSTGPITAQLGGLAALPVFLQDGVTQATTGNIVNGQEYLVVFAQSLNAGGGGWYLENAAAAATSSGLFGPRTNIASAATTDLTTSANIYVNISGTTTITSFGNSKGPNLFRIVRFSASLILTHNATSLFLPNAGNNITTQADDSLLAIQTNDGNWKVIAYQTASGQALQGGGGGAGVISPTVQFFTTSQTITIPAGATKALVTLIGGAGGGGGAAAVVGCPLVVPGYGAPGGTAGALKKYLSGLTPGNTLTLTIGGGGVAGTSAPGAGGNGGSTLLASGTQVITSLTAGFSAGGGAGNGATGTPGAGGTSTNGDINLNVGTPVVASSGGVFLVQPNPAGYGVFNPNTPTVAAAGNNANGFGAPGAGGVSLVNAVNFAGGNGGAGYCEITWFA